VSPPAPTDGQSLLNLAGIYGQLQQHAEAASAVGEVPGARPGQLRAHIQRGTHLLLAGKSDEAARRDADRAAAAARLGARVPDAGRHLQPGRQADEAVENYKQALEVDSGNVRIRLGLGEVLLDDKKPQDALAEVRDRARDDPQNRFALDLKARALRDLRKFDEADALADRLLAPTATT
jgi:tetratricopeptide (TPR) repeat protein